MNTLAQTQSPWPGWAALGRVLWLSDYNTRVVVAGVVLLGIAAGSIGTFMLLRKRALLGDAVSHATLPGIALAFLIMSASGGSGKWLPGLLLGALLAGLAGMLAVLLIRTQTRLKEDAALGIVLSVTFGLGIALLGIIQQLDRGHAAGLEAFIYGKTASMLAQDAWLIAGAALAIITLCTLLFKEFALLCFDQDFAAARGFNRTFLDVLMMGLVVLVTVIGLQAVGLILMIALLVIPPAAARFWTHRLAYTLLIAAAIGGLSGLIGTLASALFARLPAGAIIVVVAGAFFFLSMIFGTARGLLRRALDHTRLATRIRSQNLLRALFEYHEAQSPRDNNAPASAPAMPLPALLAARSWQPRHLRYALRQALRHGLVRRTAAGAVQLTGEGLHEARRVVHNHRLWEAYLIAYADIAPIHVDHNADKIEHILGRDMVARLESLLRDHQTQAATLTPLPLPPTGHGTTP